MTAPPPCIVPVAAPKNERTVAAPLRCPVQARPPSDSVRSHAVPRVSSPQAWHGAEYLGAGAEGAGAMSVQLPFADRRLVHMAVGALTASNPATAASAATLSPTHARHPVAVTWNYVACCPTRSRVQCHEERGGLFAPTCWRVLSSTPFLRCAMCCRSERLLLLGSA